MICSLCKKNDADAHIDNNDDRLVIMVCEQCLYKLVTESKKRFKSHVYII